jgi:hypothetical protein
MSTVAIYVVRTEGENDMLTINEHDGHFVLSGAHPPRFIKRAVEIMDLERFILDSGLYEILEVERYP